MKLLFLIAIVSSLVGCTHYQTSAIHDNKVMVAKNVQFLVFHWGDVYTCRTNDEGIFQTCVVNSVQDEAAKLAQEQREKSRKASSGSN